MNKKKIIVLLVLVFAAGYSGKPLYAEDPPMVSPRKVSEQDCTRPLNDDGGNLLCHQVTAAERRAKIAEEERQARARKEAQERAARERLERERAAQLAREEAARKARAAEEQRLAALAALKAQQERERQAKLQAELLARQRAEREAREAAERECLRLAQEQADGRALLVKFVDNYGKVEENKGIAGQITTFLGKAPKVKSCPPA